MHSVVCLAPTEIRRVQSGRSKQFFDREAVSNSTLYNSHNFGHIIFVPNVELYRLNTNLSSNNGNLVR